MKFAGWLPALPPQRHDGCWLAFAKRPPPRRGRGAAPERFDADMMESPLPPAAVDLPALSYLLHALKTKEK